jgi:hypothetical protein
VKLPAVRLDVALIPSAALEPQITSIAADTFALTLPKIVEAGKEIVKEILKPLEDPLLIVLKPVIEACATIFAIGYTAESVRYDILMKRASISPVKVDSFTQRQIECFYSCDAVAKAEVVFGVKIFTNNGAQAFGDRIYIGTERAPDYNTLISTQEGRDLLYHELKHVEDYRSVDGV